MLVFLIYLPLVGSLFLILFLISFVGFLLALTNNYLFFSSSNFYLLAPSSLNLSFYQGIPASISYT